jgi:acyl carrier protein
MEADLGIDSIKRVEILNGIQEQLPDLPQLNPEELAELRTLQQIVDYMKRHAGYSEPAKQMPESEKATPPMQEPAADKNGFVGVLLDVISEKTGYQADTLEMDMDMEADLGIDSIKRVEILNGLQEQMPDMPAVNPEELAELRTLQQIADYVLGKSGSEAASAPTEPDAQFDASNALDILTKALLEVVSEKTGYLEDMLELSMDLEADLGIDSIKRVEILNGIQEKLPDLPETNPEELAELRTLEQIVNKMVHTGSPVIAHKAGSEKKKQVAANTASIAG